MIVSRRTLALLGALGLLVVLLACDGGMLTAVRAPRWACPSPTPLPFGEAGPVKREWQECPTIPVTGVQACETKREYYAEWEQEYGSAGGPPFPSPTPYAMNGTSYAFGQRVEVWPFHVLIDALVSTPLDGPAYPPDSQLYRIRITWLNHTTSPIPMDYTTRVRLRSITNPAGRIVSSDEWGVTAAALRAVSSEPLLTSIPSGESTVIVPIIGPRGTPKTVDVQFLADPDYRPTVATATIAADGPTPSPEPTIAVGTPTPNAALQDPSAQYLTVQWNAVTLRNGPGCGSSGAITDWGNVDDPGPLVRPAPPGDARVLQVALNQLGKPYVWGAKGPERFDCSGLTEWSYGQIGIRIPRGTAGQWPQMRPVDAGAVEAGDLVFFAIDGERVDHVGLLGDFNGDGQWDLLHAANPQLGVRIDYSVFRSAYYSPRIRGFRTAR